MPSQSQRTGSAALRSALVFLAEGLNTLHQGIALVAGGEVLPAPLTHHNHAEQFKQPRNDRQQIDRVEDSLDHEQSNDHCRKYADDLADPSHLIPIDLVEGVVHLAENVAVALSKGGGVLLSGSVDGCRHGCGGILYFSGGVTHEND